MTVKNEITFALANGRTVAFEMPEKDFHAVMQQVKQLQEIDCPYYSVSVLNECDHENAEKIEIPGIGDSIKVCNDCGGEVL